MPTGADIISLAAHARESLAAARATGADETELAHLALVAGHDALSPKAADTGPARPTDIQFPLRSIPKWVPSAD
jgi:hypothetical protein